MDATMTVTITPNDKGNPAGKLADAELHFTDLLTPGVNRHTELRWRSRQWASPSLASSPPLLPPPTRLAAAFSGPAVSAHFAAPA